MEKTPLTRKIQEWLLLADIAIDAQLYVVLAGVFSLTIPALLALLGIPPYICALVYLALLLVALYVPRYMARLRAEAAEAELPYALMTIASLIDAGIDFPTAIEAVTGDSVLGKAFRRVLDVYNRGIPMSRALKRVGNQFMSKELKRAFSHLAVLYQTGTETNTIKRIAESLIRLQEFEAKRFTAKLAVYTLVFIAVAALIPSLYLMYVVLSVFALGTSYSLAEVLYTVLGLFPLITAATLAIMYAKTPAFMRG